MKKIVTPLGAALVGTLALAQLAAVSPAFAARDLGPGYQVPDSQNKDDALNRSKSSQKAENKSNKAGKKEAGSNADSKKKEASCGANGKHKEGGCGEQSA